MAQPTLRAPIDSTGPSVEGHGANSRFCTSDFATLSTHEASGEAYLARYPKTMRDIALPILLNRASTDLATSTEAVTFAVTGVGSGVPYVLSQSSNIL